MEGVHGGEERFSKKRAARCGGLRIGFEVVVEVENSSRERFAPLFGLCGQTPLSPSSTRARAHAHTHTHAHTHARARGVQARASR